MVSVPRGLVFNIQRFSVQDGPGIRTTVFMKGCPLTCPWCSNPEGMSPVPQIMTNDRKCILCRKCLEICPTGAITAANGTRAINWGLCSNCLECAGVCPSRSIEAVGSFMTVEEVFKVVARDAPFYVNTGGGVTVSGGEPMLQWEFVLSLFQRCQQAGFHTALDTTGHCRWEDMARVLEHVDLVLFDVKHVDTGRLRGECGVGSELILANLKRVATSTRVWLRMPLIPGFNDSEMNLREVAQLAAAVRADKVSLLPYHEYGKHKYGRLGRAYPFDRADVVRPDDEIVERSAKLLESYGLAVGVGG
jgi:pyruvate formate lyase activating enzyme